MTKIAIISDIHANTDALQLVLNDIEKRCVDKVICLGDIITKYYYPKETVDIIKNNCDTVLKGNCDNNVVKNENYRWARSLLGSKRLEYLDSLPASSVIKLGEVLINLYHSNPNDMEMMFNPLFDSNHKGAYKDKIIEDYKKMFPDDNKQTTIVGHTHMDYIGTENNNSLLIEKDPTVGRIILPTDRSIINVGSVGEPNTITHVNNGISTSILPELTYLIIDDKDLSQGFKAQIIKVPYTETLKKVFFDSLNNQKKGIFPYSPNDSRKIADSIIEQNPNDTNIKKEIENQLQENNEIHKR